VKSSSFISPRKYSNQSMISPHHSPKSPVDDSHINLSSPRRPSSMGGRKDQNINIPALQKNIHESDNNFNNNRVRNGSNPEKIMPSISATTCGGDTTGGSISNRIAKSPYGRS